MRDFKREMSKVFPLPGYSNFYFWYFAFVGAFFPYFSLYLKWLGFETWQISVSLAIGPLMRVLVPYFWGILADRSKAHWVILITLTLVALFNFGWLGLVDSFYVIVICLILFNMAISGILPIIEERTFFALGERVGSYGLIRLWGSVGFILSVFVCGLCFEKYGLVIFHVSVFSFLLAVFLSLFFVSLGKFEKSVLSTESIGNILHRRDVVVAFIVFFLMQFAHGPLNGFFSLFLEELGYRKSIIGFLWGLGVVAEVFLFLALPQLMRNFSIKYILGFSALVATIRFLVIAFFANQVLGLIFAQLLHAFTFGAFHAAGIAAVNRVFAGSSAVRGQALYTSVGYGAGGGLGILFAGMGWSLFGGQAIFVGAGLFSMLTAILIFYVPRIFD